MFYFAAFRHQTIIISPAVVIVVYTGISEYCVRKSSELRICYLNHLLFFNKTL